MSTCCFIPFWQKLKLKFNSCIYTTIIIIADQLKVFVHSYKILNEMLDKFFLVCKQAQLGLVYLTN